MSQWSIDGKLSHMIMNYLYLWICEKDFEMQLGLWVEIIVLFY